MKRLVFVFAYFISLLCMKDLYAWDTFDDYEREMHARRLPLTLIVGCGHGTEYTDGDHTHPDAWCVNLEQDPVRKGLPGHSKDSHSAEVQYDQILDIATFPYHLNRKAILRDGASVRYAIEAPIVGYKNKFDVVVLERPGSDTLNKPWTFWNAVHMLNVGGELVIDSCMGYNYANSIYRPCHAFYESACKSKEQDVSVSTDLRIQRLKKYGIQSEKSNPDMYNVRKYLERWYLGDMINVSEGYSPYTMTPGGALEATRKTRILSATKTQKTEDAMEEWARTMISVRGLILLQQ